MTSLQVYQNIKESMIENRQIKKIVIFGYNDVGKTSLLYKYHFNHFSSNKNQNANAVYTLRKLITQDNQQIELEIKDTPSFDYYFALVPQHHSSFISGYILLYSVDNARSFEIIKTIRQKLFDLNGIHLPQILIGNKSDLPQRRQVTYSEGSALADQWKIPFFEISCKADKKQKIQQVFQELLEDIQEEENPNQRKKCSFKIRKIDKKKRQKFMQWFLIVNLFLIITAIFFIFYGIYVYSQLTQSLMLELWNILSGVMSLVASSVAIMSITYRREELIIAFLGLALTEIALSVIALISHIKHDNSIELHHNNQITQIVLIFVMAFKITMVILSPIIYKILKIEKHSYILEKQRQQKLLEDYDD